MAGNSGLSALHRALTALTNWLSAERIRHVVIGGMAASFLGRPRVTRDIDVLISLEEEAWPQFVSSGGQWSFVPRAPDCLAFARTSRVLLLRHDLTSVDVDLVCAGLPFEEEVIDHASDIEMAGVSVRLPTPEDLVVMKAVAMRPRDIIDIEGILDTHPHRMNWHYVLALARAFADALAQPEILLTLESLRQKQRPHAGPHSPSP